MARKLERKYTCIWTRIKQRETVDLKVAPIFVANVKRMVSKEKDMDRGFKLMNEHDFFKLIFIYDRNTQVLRIKLKQRIGIESRVIV